MLQVDAMATNFNDRVLIAALRNIVGRRHVLTRGRDISAYATGYRAGGGPCLAVVRPGTLLELWRVLEACIGHNTIIIVQAANTGLTGGSTPAAVYDRDVIVVSVRRIKGIRLLRGGAQVVCFPGASLNELERVLRPLGREPHSVIGSSCVGASVIGGVCNNSGGALVRRGPAYTELSLFARLNPDGRLELVNHLGLNLGESPESILAALDSGHINLDEKLERQTGRASDDEYGRHVREVDEGTPARFNADPRRLHEASGCAGKVAVFAVRLDTFVQEQDTVTFYIGTNNPDELTELRRALLSSSAGLPISAEYLHRGAFSIAERYGKDMFLAIELLGTNHLPLFYEAKRRLDKLAQGAGLISGFSDRLLQFVADILPSHLPVRLTEYRDRYEHHLLLKVARNDVAFAREYLQRPGSLANGAFFECTPSESRKAFLHRFVTAGAAVRYRAVHRKRIADIVAIDIALRRNDRDWVEHLPPALEQKIEDKLYYGHFFCHVFHQDYLVSNGVNPIELEHELLLLAESRGAEYPAEHNVGHLYPAKPALENHYRNLDPLNVFNPGVGGLSKRRGW
jgi:D-lactate dehydrogenase